MKNIFLALSIIVLSACAQKKENRETFKEDHNARHMVNELGDSATANSDSSLIAKDSISSN